MIAIPPIPPGSTHLEYCNPKASIVASIEALGDFTAYKAGKIRFGKYHAGSDRFESLMPGDQGEYPKEFADLVPAPVPMQRDQHRTMRDLPPVKVEYLKSSVTSSLIPKLPPGLSAAPKPAPKAPKAPKGEGKGAKVWAVCDAFYAKHGHAPSKEDALEVLPPDFNPGMVNTQIWQWRQHSKAPPAPKKPKA